ncbi:MAG: MFS transporter [Streptosporangiaceae bacterium]|jgi:predicted MFS family arabinose efflux permease
MTAALTYRSLFTIREFRVLFLNRCVVVISVAASGLALATITYEATRSAVLSGLSMFGGPLVSLVVSQFLLASSDRVRPRTALMGQMVAALVSDALQLIPGMSWQLRFGLLAIPYAAYAMFAGTRWVLVREIVPEGSYILARSTMNLADGGMQVVGYGVGGLALLWLSPRGLFGLAALGDLLALASVRVGIRARPARTADGSGDGNGGNVVRRSAAVNWRLLRSPVTRPLYIALWVPNGLIVGCESLFIPYGHSGSGGHGAVVGWLFAATAAGMMAGDLLVGRFMPPGRRDRFIEPLRLLLAVPYLFFFLAPPVAVAVPLGFLASAGYAASLPLQDRLIRHTDDAIQGQVLGLHANGVMIWQAIGALIAGAVASCLPPAVAMGTMAAASTAATLLLVPGLRRSAAAAHIAPAANPARCEATMSYEGGAKNSNAMLSGSRKDSPEP